MEHEFFQGRKVVVTGGSGFVGTHFVAALRAAGAQVRVPLHRRELKVPQTGIETVRADLADQESCRAALRGAEIVVHAAGAVSAAGVTSALSAMAAIRANLALTANVLEAAMAENAARLLLFGSSTGYPLADHPVREEEMWGAPPAEAYFGYGWMRRYLEKLGEFAMKRSGLRLALCRPTAIYGPHDDFHPRTSHVIPARIREAVERRDPYVVWGDGMETRDFLHVADLVRGCLLLLEKKCDGEPVNIGCGRSATMREIVEIILQESGHGGCEVRYDATKPATIRNRLVDTSKARALLGFEPRVGLREGLRQTIAWYRGALEKS